MFKCNCQELTTLPKPNLSAEVKDLLVKAGGNGNGNGNGNANANGNGNGHGTANGDGPYPATDNPSLHRYPVKKPTQNLRKSQIVGARYYGRVDDYTWPPEVRAYNTNFTKALSIIKRRHDPVVTTMGIL